MHEITVGISWSRRRCRVRPVIVLKEKLLKHNRAFILIRKGEIS